MPQSLLIIGTVWPEPTSSAAGSRMIQLIKLFQKRGWAITFSSSADKSEHSADLASLGIDEVPIRLNSPTFDRFIDNLSPDAVLFDRFMTEEQYGWRVAEQCPDAVRILDTEDLHSLRNARHAALKREVEFSTDQLLNNKIAKREIASIYRCDLTLIISEAEMDILEHRFSLDKTLLHYLPFLMKPISDDEMNKLPGYDDRRGFVSIGNFLHEPNRDAVLWLKYEIWPKIRKKQPDAVIRIYGAYPSEPFFQLHKEEEGFLVKGRAEDAHQVLKNRRVLLAPLRFGAGLKGKLVDAMQCGTPSVTTSIGAEGISAADNWPGFIQNATEDFADAAVHLNSNESTWEKAGLAGLTLIGERFDRTGFEAPFFDRLSAIMKNLEDHRRNNFTGSMLMQQTAQASKYMSKWIEEKNRDKN